MRLHRLTGLEQDKIVAEYRELLESIRDLSDILARAERLTQVVRSELLEVRAAYGDARRTEINRDHLDLTTEDLIEPQDVVVTLSHAGYAKSSRSPSTRRSAAADAARPPPRSRTRISSRSCSSPIRTTPCCAFSNRGKCTGSRCTSCHRPDAARAASRW